MVQKSIINQCYSCSSRQLRLKGFSAPVRALNGKRLQRYRCLSCGIQFNENFEKINYRLKHPDQALNAKIFHLSFHGGSNRKIARCFGISEHCVRIRIKRLAQRAFTFQSQTLEAFKINEPLCYDGLENFAQSQYDPNNINQVIGRDSLFIYDFNYASLNRKGRMSPWQKNRLREIENEFGRYNPKAIRIATHDLLRRMHKKCDLSPMPILSDEHFQYRRCIKNELKDLRFEHITISSKACRNFQNILFSVNHADLVIRQQVGAFSRETICFSKNAASMCQRYALFMVYKNFMAPQFTKKHVRRPHAHVISPAQTIGITNRILGFSDIFSTRSVQPSSSLNRDWKLFYKGEIPKPQMRNKKYLRSTSV